MKYSICILVGMIAIGSFAHPGKTDKTKALRAVSIPYDYLHANTTADAGPWQRDGNTFDSCRTAGHDVYCCKYKLNSAGHITTHNGHWIDPDKDCVKTDVHSPCTQSDPQFENGPYCCRMVKDFSKAGGKKNFNCAKVGIGYDG